MRAERGNNMRYDFDFSHVYESVYRPHGFECDTIIAAPESKEYDACSFILNNKRVQFRVAKITPTKKGQFVTFWKRIGSGPIVPFDLADPVDLFVVAIKYGDREGQFVFPKQILWQQGFVSKDGVGGKRAMRVYPPWDVVDSQQAHKTQAWQVQYFVEVAPVMDKDRLQELFR
jgi:hypothetical protein